MIRIKQPAIKTREGKIYRAAPHGHHDQIKHNGEQVKGKRGFILSTGEFVGRKKAARFAFLSGQTTKLHHKLHSHDL